LHGLEENFIELTALKSHYQPINREIFFK